MRLKLSALAAAAALTLPAGAAFAQSGPTYFATNPDAVFSEAVQVGDLMIFSGIIVGKKGTMDEESKGVMEALGASLGRRGLTFKDVVKCTVMIADMSKWDDFNKIYVTYFEPGRRPARSAFGANGLARGAQVELECWAYAGKKK